MSQLRKPRRLPALVRAIEFWAAEKITNVDEVRSLLIELRKCLEASGRQKEFPVLKLYTDWHLHNEITFARHAQALKSITLKMSSLLKHEETGIYAVDYDISAFTDRQIFVDVILWNEFNDEIMGFLLSYGECKDLFSSSKAQTDFFYLFFELVAPIDIDLTSAFQSEAGNLDHAKVNKWYGHDLPLVVARIKFRTTEGPKKNYETCVIYCDVGILEDRFPRVFDISFIVYNGPRDKFMDVLEDEP